MGNTLRSFEHMEADWLRRAERSEQENEGHRCYAYQQADIWNSMAKRAEKRFGQYAH